MYIASVKYNNRLPLLVSCELDEFANSMTRSVLKRYGT